MLITRKDKLDNKTKAKMLLEANLEKHKGMKQVISHKDEKGIIHLKWIKE